MTPACPGDFASWGWRVPFLLSVVLIVVGYLSRRAVAESPVFKEDADRKEESKAPLGELLRKHKKAVLYSTMIFINNAAGYLLIAFFISYATKTLKMPTPQILPRLRDRLRLDDPDVRPDRHQGHRALRRRAVRPDGRPGPVLRAHVRHVRRGFPANVRYSGISIGYAFRRHPRRRVCGHHRGGPAAGHPLDGSMGIYIMILCVISAAGVLLAGETRGRPLGLSKH